MSNAEHTTPDRGRKDAELYEHQRRAFHLHLGAFAGSMVIIILVNLAINAAANITGEWWAWWSILALLGWGLGVTVHGVVLRLARPGTIGSA